MTGPVVDTMVRYQAVRDTCRCGTARALQVQVVRPTQRVDSHAGRVHRIARLEPCIAQPACQSQLRHGACGTRANTRAPAGVEREQERRQRDGGITKPFPVELEQLGLT